MASSDDEAETRPQSVSNYHLEIDKDDPVSFSVLPIHWSESESTGSKKEQVFLRGFADNGLKNIYMEVIAWKFDLCTVKPEIAVRSKDKKWIKLQKPRNCFEDTIRTILITVHFLHYVRKNSETSAKSLWDHLSKVFSSYEVRPSENDLLNHMGLIREAARRDAILAKCKLLHLILEGKLGNKKLSDEEVKNLARPAFIVDDADDDAIDEAPEESDDDDNECFDSVCAFCDNGGNLLCCDGECMRSFHSTKEDGAESLCDSLGFTMKEVDEIQNFYCKNCEYKQHQCFVCGKLGSSGKSSGSEVFRCVSATCGRFYHPRCVVNLLLSREDPNAKELEKNIADGQSFTCPIHYCCVCKETENKKEHDMQFAVCRRCPKSYHRKCLPREIAFEDIEDEGIVTRAWEDLLPYKRVLIYCLNHEIDDEIGTPVRDHIKFPKSISTVRETSTTKEERSKPEMKKKIKSDKKNVDLDDSFSTRATPKISKSAEKSSFGKLDTKKRSEKSISGSNIPRKPKAKEASRCLNENKRLISKEIDKADGVEAQPSLGDKLYALMSKGPEQIKPGKQADAANKSLSVKPMKKELSAALPSLDSDSERRIVDLFKEATSSITLESVLEKRKVASTHTHPLRYVVEKTITVGKLEASVHAVRTALTKLEGGCSIQDVEAVCDSDDLTKIFKWKDKLKVYLAPVLYGNRYTSYGRHFTQPEKLEGIVDRLHWYVKNGDMIVDFCCGANDFSVLMKKKLEETGKKCLYKNFDLLPTKNDFSFEMRDWMTVQPKELPSGSQLIMGLNPPFGLKASLANKFIDKALQFKPKLLILIVPPETQRLDEKRSPYDLVWEDDTFLAGKSFYLPGSVDVNDKQLEQWNLRAPLLYLWSRPDWTDKHKAIAEEQGHLSSQQEVLKVESIHTETSPAGQTMDGSFDDNIKPSDNLLKPTDDPEDFRGQSSTNEVPNESPLHSSVDQENQESQEQRMSRSDKTLLKRKNSEEYDEVAVSQSKRQAVNETYGGKAHYSPHNVIEGRQSVERFQSKSVENSPRAEAGDHGHRHFEHPSSSREDFGAAYGASRKWSSAASPLSDYGARNLEQQPSNAWGGGDNPIAYGSYIREEEKYWREPEIRQHGCLYGLSHSDLPRTNYPSGHDSPYGPVGYGYGHRGSFIESSYGMNTSTMQRYAPRLDELNYSRMSTLGSQPPTAGRNGAFNPNMPQPGYGSRSMGFAPGPHPGYSGNNAGWLNE